MIFQKLQKYLLVYNKPLIFLATAWFVIASLYLIRTPFDYRAHDARGHIHYTRIVTQEHRIPKPYEGWETFQPPVYYLINSVIFPNTLKNSNFLIHVNAVRLISVVYGFITILLIAALLSEIKIGLVEKLQVLFFTVTTPKFVFLFSTYNNDSLATLLSILVIFLCYKLYKSWSNKKALLLFVCAVIGVYTKFSTIGCILAILFPCIIYLFKQKPQDKKIASMALILFASIISLLPWIIFHNIKYTNNPFPTNLEHRIRKSTKHGTILDTLKSIIVNPLQPKTKWQEPWALPVVEQRQYIAPGTKGFDYISYFFVTSIIGENEFTKPDKKVIWGILWIHLFISILAYRYIFSSNINKLSFFVIVVGHFLHLFYISRYFVPIPSPVMDFRMISWIWAPWTYIFASSLINKNLLMTTIQKTLLTTGILLHLYFLFTVTGGQTPY